MGSGYQPELVQAGHHVANGGGADIQAGRVRQLFRANGLAFADIAIDECFQQVTGSVVQLVRPAFLIHSIRRSLLNATKAQKQAFYTIY